MSRILALVALLALLAGIVIGRSTGPKAAAVAADPDTFGRGLAEADWLERADALSTFLQALGPENLEPALTRLEPELAWITTDELRLVMLAWSRFDPQGALAWSLALPRPFHRNACGAAIYAWAFRDPAAARVALEQIEDDSLRDFAQGRLVAGWAHADPGRELTEYLAALPQGPRRFAFVGMLAWELSKRGPGAVIDWAEDVPLAFPRFKHAVFMKASTTLASSDPVEAARQLAPYLERPYAEGTLRVLARSWANRDARAALGWLRELPPTTDRGAGVSHAFGVWLALDPEAAIGWLRNALPDPSLDPAVRVMVARVRPRSPARALDWSLQLSDPALRDEFVARIGRSWYHGHPEPAQAWLAGADLPEALRDAIRSPSRTEDAELPGGEWDEPGAVPMAEDELPEAP